MLQWHEKDLEVQVIWSKKAHSLIQFDTVWYNLSTVKCSFRGSLSSALGMCSIMYLVALSVVKILHTVLASYTLNRMAKS